MNIWESLFSHKHRFKHVGGFTHPSEQNSLSFAPITADIYRCRCGEEYRTLTPAGEQQVNEFGDSYKKVAGEVA